MNNPKVITENLSERKSKFVRQAPFIADEKHFQFILASFPEEERAALEAKIRPLLKFGK